MNQIEDKVMRLQTRTTGSASDYDIGEDSEEDEVRLRLSRTRQAPKKVRQLTVLKGKKNTWTMREYATYQMKTKTGY
jgi:hypothetical protein